MRQAGATPAQAESPGLCLEVVPGRSGVRLGEPVVVAVALANCSREPKQVEDLLAPEYGFLQVSLSPPGGGKPVPCRPRVRRDARGKRPRALGPGQGLSAWVPLYACSDGWLPAQPGRHLVHAEYAFEGARIRAAPAPISVEAPGGPAGRAAADLMMDESAGMLLLAGRDDGGSRRLSALLREHPESPLVPYAQMALGTGRMQERFDPVLKAFRAADCEGAVQLLEPAVARVADPLLAAQGVRSLARCLRKLGREAEAEAAVRGYWRAHPGARELPGVLEALQRKDAGRP